MSGVQCHHNNGFCHILQFPPHYCPSTPAAVSAPVNIYLLCLCSTTVKTGFALRFHTSVLTAASIFKQAYFLKQTNKQKQTLKILNKSWKKLNHQLG